MKSKLQFLIVMGLAVTMSIAAVHAQEQKETLGDKLKRLFTRASPTATPRRTHKRTSSPSPNASPNESPTTSPGEDQTVPTYGETPLPQTESSASAATPIEAKIPETQYFEPVRPINPGPAGRSAAPRIQQGFATPPATETPIPSLPEEPRLEDRPTPSLQTVPIPNAESNASAQPMPNEQSPIPALTPRESAPISTTESAPLISIDAIADSSSFPSDVRKMIEVGLDLEKQHLIYKYASADPQNGGLDCSGFIYYVLTKSGVKSVPRDARDQYVWVRKAGNFQAVLGHGDDTFELDSLRPGDLLFWANNSGLSHEPEITQITIYIGRDKVNNQRLMIGASEAATYKGEKKSGVGVFDFKPGAVGQDSDEPPASVFVGYGRFPDLSPN